MNERPESFWWKIWGFPRRFFSWLTLISGFAVVAAGFIIDSLHRGPYWNDFIARGIIFAFVTIFVLSIVALILSLIPQTRFLTSWILRRWFFCAAVFVTLITLFYAEEDWRGKRAWENRRHQLEAEGVVMDWNKYIPPPLPDDQNIFKAPKMTEWFVRTNGQQDLVGDLGRRLQAPKSAPEILRDPTKSITTEAQAKEYLAWSDQFTPDFDVIREALKRPYARMDGDYSGLLTLPTPNVITTRGMARVLAKRAHCHLLLHQPDEALAELTLLHGMCRMLESPPGGKSTVLISVMLNTIVTGLYVDTLADGLELHAWRDEQLKTLEDQLKGTHLLADLVDAMNIEAPAVCHTIESVSLDKAMPSWHSHLDLFSVEPRGWIYQNLANLIDAYRAPQKNIDPARNIVMPRAADEVAHQLEWSMHHRTPFNTFAAVAVPNFLKATQLLAGNQNLANQALIACALERYHLAHNDYPESLNTLVPQFIDKIPPDVAGGGDLKYRQNAGSFVLYSIGWNQKDDGGRPSRLLENSGTPDWSSPDWTWPPPANALR